MNELRSILLLLFLLPGVTLGQTVHVEKGKIVYKGTLDVGGRGKDDAYNKARKLILGHVNQEKDSLKEDKEKNELESNGQMRLHSTYQLAKTIYYRIKFKVKDGDLKYEINDVYLKLHERGGETKLIPSEEILKGMDTSGKSSMDTERQLNEIDMHIQKLLALMNAEMK